MPSASLLQVPETETDFRAWSFAHMANHRDINRRIMEVHSIRIDEYALDPFDPDSMDEWLDLHQDMHNQQNKALGIPGYILSELDWQDKSMLESWIWANADEHSRASTLLGV